ncbi:MAG: T9SS type A sorting domain-containing protein [Bacteroidia bacterium]|nr:T9SS type A sorting domain-containing protein [Bacteroidia bacterium]
MRQLFLFCMLMVSAKILSAQPPYSGTIFIDPDIITAVTTMNLMLSSSGLSVDNYDNTLISWSVKSVNSGVRLGASGLEYCNGTTARDTLVSTYGWIITGDSENLGGCVLPVEWLSLSATPINNQVKVAWSTASELNSDYFVVERSVDQGRWDALGQVSATGYSSSASAYQFDDTQPIVGKAFYRLRQVDVDGTFDYSQTVEITLLNDGIAVYPNPVKDLLHLDLPGQTPVQATIIDFQGRVAIRQSLQPGNNSLSVAQLPAGLYLLRLNDGQGWTQDLPIVKE